MAHLFGAAAASFPGVAGDGNTPGGLRAQGVLTSAGVYIVDVNGVVLGQIASDGSLLASAAITLVAGDLHIEDADQVTHFLATAAGAMQGGSNADGNNWIIDALGNATVASLQCNGAFYLPNGSVSATPVSLTASLSNQQAQINQLVALLVAWGVVTDDRVP